MWSLLQKNNFCYKGVPPKNQLIKDYLYLDRDILYKGSIYVDLEDNGGELSVHSNWESRIMNDDIMISLVDKVDFTISEINLALFDDSGWYETKYYNGSLFRAGKGRGCNFLTSNCKKQNQFFIMILFIVFLQKIEVAHLQNQIGVIKQLKKIM